MKPLLALVAAAALAASFGVFAQQAPKSPGRYVAITPPEAGDKTYANFLWVLDTQTGDVTVYRIANAKNLDGTGNAWVTERAYSEAEWFRIMDQQQNRAAQNPAAP